MRRIFLSVLLQLGLVTACLAQEPGPSRSAFTVAPRFLAGVAPDARAVEPSAVPALQRRVTLGPGEATLGAALDAITQQTGIRFLLSSDVISADKPVRVEANGLSLAAALTELLLDARVDIAIVSPTEFALLARRDAQEPGTITGTVTHAETQEPIVNAQVAVEGTGRGTFTDAEGGFRIADVPAGRHIVSVTSIGYRRSAQEVEVPDGATVTVDFALDVSPTTLNELVVTATGQQRRVELGHVVGRIDADSVVREAPISTLSELLTARVPGLQVFQTQGTVGGRVVLQLRGPNSMSLGNQPIVVVDGMRYTTEERPAVFGTGPGDVEPASPLNDINPNDIESIEVVKGPSAATLYGTDASNGVIVITTKRGRPGPARWNTYAKATVTSIPERDFPDTYWGWGDTASGESCDLAALAEGRCTTQDSITVLPNPLNDPELTIFGAKPRWEYGVNVGGGQQDLRYYFSADFEDATGPIQMPPAIAKQIKQERGLSELPEEWREPNAFTKLNLRSNVTARLGEKADVLITSGYIHSSGRTLSRVWSPYSAARSAGDPRLDSPYGSSASNPAEIFAQTTTEKTDRFLVSASGNWRPARWFSARAMFGVDIANSNRYGLVRPGDQPNDPAGNADGAVEDSQRRQVATTGDVGATARAHWGRLSARTTVGAQYVRSLQTASVSLGQGLPPGGTDVQRALNVYASQQHLENVVLGGYVEETVGLNDRLFLTGALRIDGASTFGRGFSAALYPKVGASWLISEEPFLPQLPGIDELRLRYSFGASGQQPDPAAARPSFAAGQMYLGGEPVHTLRVSGLGNPNLRPEQVREHEFGFDASVLDNRVALNVTWFRRRTVDQLISEAGPPGRGSIVTNLGLTTQRGFEAQLDARIVDTSRWSWNLTLQHSDYSTQLVDLGDGSASASIRGGYVEGYPLGVRRQNLAVVDWEDANGDGIIGRDEVVLDGPVSYGASIPPRAQTLSTMLSIFDKHVRLSALFERRSGFTQINSFLCPFRKCREAVDPSTPLGEQVRALSFQGVVPENGNFTRLREVAAAIDLPASLRRAVRLSRATLVLTARNLALWTGFSGVDPEVSNVGLTIGNLSGGAASGIPHGRTLTVRLDLGY